MPHCTQALRSLLRVHGDSDGWCVVRAAVTEKNWSLFPDSPGGSFLGDQGPRGSHQDLSLEAALFPRIHPLEVSSGSSQCLPGQQQEHLEPDNRIGHVLGAPAWALRGLRGWDPQSVSTNGPGAARAGGAGALSVSTSCWAWVYPKRTRFPKDPPPGGAELTGVRWLIPGVMGRGGGLIPSPGGAASPK